MLKGITLPALLAVALTAPAQARTCTQAQLTGVWEMYFQGHLNNLNFAIACTLQFNSVGVITSGSNCVDTLGRSTPVIGSLKLANAPSCNYEGALNLTAVNDINKVERTTLSVDHNVMAGAVYDVPSTIGYAFTMMRIQ